MRIDENTSEMAYEDALELLKTIESNAIEDYDWVEDEYEEIKTEFKRNNTKALIQKMKYYRMLLDREGIREMKKKDNDVIEISEEVAITQENGSTIVLEAGDKIKINEEVDPALMNLIETSKKQLREVIEKGAFSYIVDAYEKAGYRELQAINAALMELSEILENYIGGLVDIDWRE